MPRRMLDAIASGSRADHHARMHPCMASPGAGALAPRVDPGPAPRGSPIPDPPAMELPYSAGDLGAALGAAGVALSGAAIERLHAALARPPSIGSSGMHPMCMCVCGLRCSMGQLGGLRAEGVALSGAPSISMPCPGPNGDGSSLGPHAHHHPDNPEHALSLPCAALSSPAAVAARLRATLSLESQFPGFSLEASLSTEGADAWAVLRSDASALSGAMRVFQDLAPRGLPPVGTLMPAIGRWVARSPSSAAAKLSTLQVSGSTALRHPPAGILSRPCLSGHRSPDGSRVGGSP
jgi:hypothetical protein